MKSNLHNIFVSALEVELVFGIALIFGWYIGAS